MKFSETIQSYIIYYYQAKIKELINSETQCKPCVTPCLNNN